MFQCSQVSIAKTHTDRQTDPPTHANITFNFSNFTILQQLASCQSHNANERHQRHKKSVKITEKKIEIRFFWRAVSLFTIMSERNAQHPLNDFGLPFFLSLSLCFRFSIWCVGARWKVFAIIVFSCTSFSELIPCAGSGCGVCAMLPGTRRRTSRRVIYFYLNAQLHTLHAKTHTRTIST